MSPLSMLADDIKTALKRGALIAVANWEVVAIQFVAESAFKALLMVPVVGAVFLMALVVGGSAADLAQGGLQHVLGEVIDALDAHPAALSAYLTGLLAVIVGGSVMMFRIKGGTAGVLVESERAAGAVERPPLRLARVREASRFSIDRFCEQSDKYAGRFLRLGLALLAAYAVSGAAYLGVVLAAYRWTADPGVAILGSMTAAAASLVFGVWLTVVNLLYLLAQILVAANDWPVGRAARALPELLVAERRLIAGIFIVMLALVAVATIASVLATGALGFIGFVPIVGLAVLPLQLLAWLARGLLFQFLGLSALGAYASVARRQASRQARPLGRAVELPGRMSRA